MGATLRKPVEALSWESVKEESMRLLKSLHSLVNEKGRVTVITRQRYSILNQQLFTLERIVRQHVQESEGKKTNNEKTLFYMDFIQLRSELNSQYTTKLKTGLMPHREYEEPLLDG